MSESDPLDARCPDCGRSPLECEVLLAVKAGLSGLSVHDRLGCATATVARLESELREARDAIEQARDDGASMARANLNAAREECDRERTARVEAERVIGVLHGLCAEYEERLRVAEPAIRHWHLGCNRCSHDPVRETERAQSPDDSLSPGSPRGGAGEPLPAKPVHRGAHQGRVAGRGDEEGSREPDASRHSKTSDSALTLDTAALAEPGDAAGGDGAGALRKLLAECAHAMEREAPYSRRKALIGRIDAILERAPRPAIPPSEKEK